MDTELNTSEQGKQQQDVNIQAGSSDAVYGFGVIGAWVYYIGRATTPRDKVLGFFKGIVWPAFLVFELLEFLNKE